MGFEADWALDNNDNQGLPRAPFRKTQVVWVGIYRSNHPTRESGITETIRVFSSKSLVEEWLKFYGDLDEFENIHIEEVEVW